MTTRPLAFTVLVAAGAAAGLIWLGTQRTDRAADTVRARSTADVPPSPAPGAETPTPLAAPPPLTPATGIHRGPTPVRAFNAPATPPPIPAEPRSPLADRLNASDGGIQGDLRIIADILENYHQRFGEMPIGTNAEITAALAGDNRLGHAPLPADHPAIDEQGRLLDRWGTPFFFHQLSRDRMDIRSAGPDRHLFTDDDIVWPDPEVATAPPPLAP